MEIIDLTHELKSGMPVYPGDEKPVFSMSSVLEKDGHNNTRLTSTTHVGTHIDAPIHMLANGKTLAEYSADKYFGNGIILNAEGRKEIDIDLLANKNIQPGDIVLVYTGMLKIFGSEEYFSKSPLVTEKFANELVNLKVSIVGLDTSGPDEPPFLIHKILLSKDILIIENLTNLNSLLEKEKFEVIALPLKVSADGSPARVVARVSN